MPSVATWWCGQEEPLRHVREHLSDLVIKPAFLALRPSVRSFRMRSMKPGATIFSRRIEARPEEFRGAGAGGVVDGAGLQRDAVSYRGT